MNPEKTSNDKTGVEDKKKPTNPFRKHFRKWARISLLAVAIVSVIHFVSIHLLHLFSASLPNPLTNSVLIFVCLYLIFGIGGGLIYASIRCQVIKLKSGKFIAKFLKHRDLYKVCITGLWTADLPYKRDDEKRTLQLSYPYEHGEIKVEVNVGSDRFTVSTSYGWEIPESKIRPIIEFVERVNGDSTDVVKLHLDYGKRKLGTVASNHFGVILDSYDVKTLLVNIIDWTRKLYEISESPVSQILHDNLDAATAHLEFKKLAEMNGGIEND